MALTDLQIRKLTRLFHVLDVDGNGVIEKRDHDEIVANLAALREWRVGTDAYSALHDKMMGMWEHLAAMAPADDQGRVSLPVWLEYHERRFARVGGEHEVVLSGSDLAIDLIDIDQDGRLSRVEYRNFYTVYGIELEAADAIFDRLDMNADGFLTEDEIDRLMWSFYFSDEPDAPGNWFFGPV